MLAFNWIISSRRGYTSNSVPEPPYPNFFISSIKFWIRVSFSDLMLRSSVIYTDKWVFTPWSSLNAEFCLSISNYCWFNFSESSRIIASFSRSYLRRSSWLYFIYLFKLHLLVGSSMPFHLFFIVLLIIFGFYVFAKIIIAYL